MRIMVVEDNRAMGKLIRRWLDDHEVIWHRHADDLFDVDRWEGVDVAIIDLVYKGGQRTGFELLRWLQAQGLGGRRVVLTGYNRLDREVLGWFGYTVLVKPVDREQLRQAVLDDGDPPAGRVADPHR